MNNNDERDYAEEADNRRASDEEFEAEYLAEQARLHEMDESNELEQTYREASESDLSYEVLYFEQYSTNQNM